MPHHVTYEDDGRGAVVTFSGLVTGNEIIEHVRAIYDADPEHRLQWKLNDFLGIDFVDISNDEIRTLAQLREARAQHYPIFLNAVVATQPLVKSSSTILSVHADRVDGFRSETFRTIEAARSWIRSVLDDRSHGASAITAGS